jgi:hypothetical protein
MSERNFFHRSCAQTVREHWVMKDFASIDVEVVTQIDTSGRNKVRTQRGFSAADQ